MEKKKYISAELEIINVKTEDVLSLSNPDSIETPWDEFKENTNSNKNFGW